MHTEHKVLARPKVPSLDGGVVPSFLEVPSYPLGPRLVTMVVADKDVGHRVPSQVPRKLQPGRPPWDPSPTQPYRSRVPVRSTVTRVLVRGTRGCLLDKRASSDGSVHATDWLLAD